MSTNYTINSHRQSFGRFKFADGAKKVITNKVKTQSTLERFEELSKLEQQGIRQFREIFVDATLKNGSHSGSKLTASPGNGKWYTQGIFESPFKFLEKMIKKADVIQKENINQEGIKSSLEKLM